MLERIEEWASTVKMERTSLKGLFLSTLMLFIGACPIKIKLTEIAQDRIMEWIRSNDANYVRALISSAVLTALFVTFAVLSLLFVIIYKYFGVGWAILSCGIVLGLIYLMPIRPNK